MSQNIVLSNKILLEQNELELKYLCLSPVESRCGFWKKKTCLMKIFGLLSPPSNFFSKAK
jgi:hypothetical protein